MKILNFVAFCSEIMLFLSVVALPNSVFLHFLAIKSMWRVVLLVAGVSSVFAIITIIIMTILVIYAPEISDWINDTLKRNGKLTVSGSVICSVIIAWVSQGNTTVAIAVSSVLIASQCIGVLAALRQDSHTIARKIIATAVGQIAVMLFKHKFIAGSISLLPIAVSTFALVVKDEVVIGVASLPKLGLWIINRRRGETVHRERREPSIGY